MGSNYTTMERPVVNESLPLQGSLLSGKSKINAEFTTLQCEIGHFFTRVLSSSNVSRVAVTFGITFQQIIVVVRVRLSSIVRSW